MLPRVGTIVPSHHARYLRPALGSLVAQTVEHEIVVIDDGSPDREVSRVAKEFGVRFIRNETSLGASEARNLGIDSLDAPWILNFDHDNVADTRFLESLLRAALRGKRTGISYCRAVSIGEATGPFWPARRGLPWHLKHSNFIDANSLFARKAWEEAGGFDPKASPVSDWDLWLSIVERGWGVAFVPEFLFRYRVHRDSMMKTTSKERMKEAIDYVKAKHADFIGIRHRRQPRNLVPRVVNRIRRRLDGWEVQSEQGPMKLVLIGAKVDGQAHVVLDMLREGLPYEAIAFLDETPSLWRTEVHGLPVLGPPLCIGEAMAMGARGAVVSIADSTARERLANVAREAGLLLPTLVHPRCYVAPSAQVGLGCYLAVFSEVYTGAKVGEGVWVPSFAHVGHHAVVGDYATLAPRVVLTGRSRVGRRAFLGVGAVVLPDVTVGEDAVVGAGSVVTRDVEPGTTVAGVPARVLRE